MFTSVADLKANLQNFLENSDPQTEAEFHEWFSYVFRHVHRSNDQNFVNLVRRVQAVFAESSLGNVSGEEAFAALENLAKPTVVSVPTPKQNQSLLVMPSPTSGTGVPKEQDEEERFASAWYMESLASGRC